MGLSNEERYDKIIYSINHIVKLSSDLEDYKTEKLKKLSEKLWYEFLKNDSNGAFWIMGSDLGNDYATPGSLLSAAFCAHTPSNGNTFDEVEKKVRQEDNYYDHYKILSTFLEIDNLLKEEKSAVILIYLHMQNIAYALCRYQDEFMDQYEDLNVLLRTMQGECFKLIKEDRDYVHAWMLHHLCDKIYTMDEHDIVNQWWTTQCNSHDIRIQWDKFDEVFQLFKKYQFCELTVQDRVDLTLALMNDKYGEYEHQHKAFLEMVKQYNEKNEVKINVEAIVEAYQKTQTTKKEKDTEPYDRSCEFTGNYVYNGKVENYS